MSALLHCGIERLGLSLAEGEGFEPSRGCPQHAFQASALNHSAIPPAYRSAGPGGRRTIQNAMPQINAAK